ncbi:MAG: isoprenylcysteine carboxylmethyltransferase family protein, partial [Brevinematia bacterium]
KAIRLVKEGPYAYIRHPIYMGYILLFISAFLITGWWLFSLLGELIMLSLVIWRLPIEEKMLEERFGSEYVEYKSKVKMFIPFIL